MKLFDSELKVMDYACPAAPEYQEGFGIMLSSIAANFGLLPEEARSLSEDGRKPEQLALAFWEAYLAGDAAELAQYPAADADYLEYLTISAVKEGYGWKVTGYGLEL